ncbi:MAG: tetratricopeptide repeat protein [Phycisphaerales bacterium]
MLTTLTESSRLRAVWWATCLSAVVIAAGCASDSQTRTSTSHDAPPAAATADSVSSRFKLRPPDALSAMSPGSMSERQRRTAMEPLADVLAKIPEVKAEEKSDDVTPNDGALRAYGQARVAYEERDYRKALSLLEQAVALDDRFAAPYELLGQLYEGLGQRDRMLDAMGKAVRRDPRCVTGLYILATEAMDQDRVEEAVTLLGRAFAAKDRAIDPGMRYLVEFQFGQSLLRSGRVTAAEEAMAGYLRAEGPFGRSTTLPRQVYVAGLRRDAVLMLLGDAYLRMGDVAGAQQRYDRAAAGEDQPDAELTGRRIYAALLLGRFEPAEQLAVGMLTHTDDADAAMSLAKYVAAQTDQPGRFTRKLTDWYEQSQRGEQMALAVARVLGPADAEAFLTEHLAQSPADMAAYRALVKLYAPGSNDPGNGAKIVALTTKLAAQQPDHAGQYAAAMLESPLSYSQWDQALKARPDEERYSAVGWYLRGVVERQARHDESASAAFAKALDRNPDFVPAQEAEIEKEIADGDIQRALGLIEGSAQKDHPRLQLLKALALSLTGDVTRAMGALQPLVDKYPKNNEYLLAMAQLWRRSRRFDRAEQTGERMLANDPTYESAYELLFQIYEEDQPDATKFTQLLAKARATIPTGRVTWRKLARYHMMRNEPDQAEKVLRTLVQRYPKDAEGLRDWVGLLARGKRLDEAEKLLTGLLDADATNGAALDLLQEVAKQLDHNEVFYSRLEAFLKRLPASVENYSQLAALYDRWGKTEAGVEAVNKALAMKPDDVVPLYVQMCRLYEGGKRYDRAEKAIDQAIEARGDRPALYAIKAWLLHEAKRDDSAVKVLEDAIGKLPDQAADLRLELARLYASMDKTDLAIAQVDRVIAANQGNAADLYCLQASLLAGKRDSQKLIEKILLKALASEPDHPGANNDLGYQWADAGVNLTRAEQMIRKAVTAEPENAAYLDSMGWVQYKLGRFDQAVLWLNRATRQPNGDDPVVRDHLGDAMWRTGREEQAKRIWTEALAALEREAKKPNDRQGDELSPDHLKLLPVLREKLKAIGQEPGPVLAPVPEHPVQTVPPEQPAPAMQ